MSPVSYPHGELTTEKFPGRLYRFAWRSFNFWFPIQFGFKVEGYENFPEGGVIVAANHASYLDPPVVGSASPRQCHFLAKRELFRLPLFGRILRSVTAHPVRREDLEPSVMREMLRFLRAGEILVLFPEGTRSRTGVMGAARSGVGLFARAAQVPVLPTHLSGTAGWEKRPWARRRVRVRFGKPIPPPSPRADRSEAEAYASRVMDAIGALAADPAPRTALTSQ